MAKGMIQKLAEAIGLTEAYVPVTIIVKNLRNNQVFEPMTSEKFKEFSLTVKKPEDLYIVVKGGTHPCEKIGLKAKEYVDWYRAKAVCPHDPDPGRRYAFRKA